MFLRVAPLCVYERFTDSFGIPGSGVRSNGYTSPRRFCKIDIADFNPKSYWKRPETTSRETMKLNTLAITLALCAAAAIAAPPPANSQAGAHAPKTGGARRQAARPKTVRDFFNLLPPQYFALEGCAPERDVNCVRARAEYLKNYLEVEDIANGYMKGGCDGAQSCFQMALFRRPDGTYIVGLSTSHEESEQSYFLEYADGAWSDIGARVVPEYGEDKVYEPPRYGTTVRVFAKIFPEIDAPAVSEKGRRLYNLVWKGGRFTIKK